MARIINLADHATSELFPSFEAAQEAFAERLADWRKRGWEVVASEHEENRYTVSDASGQFVGEFCLEA